MIEGESSVTNSIEYNSTNMLNKNSRLKEYENYKEK